MLYNAGILQNHTDKHKQMRRETLVESLWMIYCSADLGSPDNKIFFKMWVR